MFTSSAEANSSPVGVMLDGNFPLESYEPISYTSEGFAVHANNDANRFLMSQDLPRSWLLVANVK